MNCPKRLCADFKAITQKACTLYDMQSYITMVRLKAQLSFSGLKVTPLLLQDRGLSCKAQRSTRKQV